MLLGVIRYFPAGGATGENSRYGDKRGKTAKRKHKLQNPGDVRRDFEEISKGAKKGALNVGVALGRCWTSGRKRPLCRDAPGAIMELNSSERPAGAASG